jgi:hypothetical protein
MQLSTLGENRECGKARAQAAINQIPRESKRRARRGRPELVHSYLTVRRRLANVTSRTTTRTKGGRASVPLVAQALAITRFDAVPDKMHLPVVRSLRLFRPNAVAISRTPTGTGKAVNRGPIVAEGNTRYVRLASHLSGRVARRVEFHALVTLGPRQFSRIFLGHSFNGLIKLRSPLAY